MKANKKAEAYWDSHAASSASDARDAILIGYRSEKEFDDAGKEDVAHLILPFIFSNDLILEIGCGVGRLLKWASMRCKKAIGIDLSGEMLKQARRRLKNCKNVTLKKMPRSLCLPFPDKFADFVYFYHVSDHLERESTYRILREIRRCLKPKGRALIQFSLFDYLDNQEEFKTWALNGDDEGVRSRYYTETEINTLLELVKLYPQIRLYIPGEFVVVVTKHDSRVLGNMPLVKLPPNQK